MFEILLSESKEGKKVDRTNLTSGAEANITILTKTFVFKKVGQCMCLRWLLWRGRRRMRDIITDYSILNRYLTDKRGFNVFPSRLVTILQLGHCTRVEVFSMMSLKLFRRLFWLTLLKETNRSDVSSFSWLFSFSFITWLQGVAVSLEIKENKDKIDDAISMKKGIIRIII